MHDDTTLAALFGLMVAMVKAIEKGGAWMYAKKNGKNAPIVVQLDPAASMALASVLTKVTKIEDIVEVRDADGMPLIFFPRRVEERISEKLDVVRQELRTLASKQRG